MPGSSRAALRALHLRLPGDGVELVGHLLQHADEDHRLAGRVLQVLQRLDHLAAEQAVGAAHVGLAAALGDGLRLLLGVDHRLPGQVGDRVDEDDRLRGEEGLEAAVAGEPADMLEVRRAVPGGGVLRRVGAADQHGEVAEVAEAADRDAGAAPVLHRLHPGLEVEADGVVLGAASSAASSCRCPAGRRWRTRSCSLPPTGVRRR